MMGVVLVLQFLYFCVALLPCLSFSFEYNSKFDGLSRDVWNSHFRSDSFVAFPTDRVFQKAVHDQWESAVDDSFMMYVVRATGRRSNQATVELINLIEFGGGHIEFVGKSDFYTAFMTKTHASAVMASETFDVVAPVPSLLKVTTELMNPDAARADEEQLEVMVSMSEGGHVNESALASRWHQWLDTSGVASALSHLQSVTEVQTGAPGALTFVPGRRHQTLQLRGVKPSTFSSLMDYLARQGEVEFLEVRHPVKSLNHYASWVTQTNYRDDTVLYTHGLTGEGHIIGFSDTGLDLSHCNFKDDSAACDPLNGLDLDCRKVVAYIAYADMFEGEAGGHGTHVGGSLAGQTEQGGSSYAGMAPDARLAFFDLGLADGSLVVPDNVHSELLPPPYDAGARVYSVSWGTTSPSYDSYARAFDRFAHEHPDFLMLVAAGNDGQEGHESVGSPATAKNIITVGASLNAAESWSSGYGAKYDQQRLAYFSSFGPTSDGRLKPEVCAPGYFIGSAESSGVFGRESCGSVGMAGTSMATPVLAGHMLLARQYFMDGFYPSGGRSAADAFVPTAALLRGVAVSAGQPLLYYLNEADEQFNMNYPSNEQGYGRAQLDQVLFFANYSQQSLYVVGEFESEQEVDDGGTVQYTFPVAADNTRPFKAVLTWTDPAASIASQHALINDLDMTVSDGSITHMPMWTSPAADDDNNLEVITVPAPSEPTEFVVTVSGASISSGSSQAFALVVTCRLEGEVYANITRSSFDDDEEDEVLEYAKLAGTLFVFVCLITLLVLGLRRLHRCCCGSKAPPPVTQTQNPIHHGNGGGAQQQQQMQMVVMQQPWEQRPPPTTVTMDPAFSQQPGPTVVALPYNQQQPPQQQHWSGNSYY